MHFWLHPCRSSRLDAGSSLSSMDVLWVYGVGVLLVSWSSVIALHAARMPGSGDPTYCMINSRSVRDTIFRLGRCALATYSRHAGANAAAQILISMGSCWTAWWCNLAGLSCVIMLGRWKNAEWPPRMLYFRGVQPTINWRPQARMAADGGRIVSNVHQLEIPYPSTRS